MFGTRGGVGGASTEHALRRPHAGAPCAADASPPREARAGKQVDLDAWCEQTAIDRLELRVVSLELPPTDEMDHRVEASLHLRPVRVLVNLPHVQRLQAWLETHVTRTAAAAAASIAAEEAVAAAKVALQEATSTAISDASTLLPVRLKLHISGPIIVLPLSAATTTTMAPLSHTRAQVPSRPSATTLEHLASS